MEKKHSPTIVRSIRIKASFGCSADQKWHNRTENSQGSEKNQLQIKLILLSIKNIVST